MNNTTVKYEDGLKADLADPLEAVAYLNAALEDGSQEVFLLALRDVTNVHADAPLRELLFFPCLFILRKYQP